MPHRRPSKVIHVGLIVDQFMRLLAGAEVQRSHLIQFFLLLFGPRLVQLVLQIHIFFLLLPNKLVELPLGFIIVCFKDVWLEGALRQLLLLIGEELLLESIADPGFLAATHYPFVHLRELILVKRFHYLVPVCHLEMVRVAVRSDECRV